MKNYKGVMYAMLASTAFGLMPIFAKYAYINGSNANTVLLYRFAISAVLLFIYLKFKKIDMRVTKKQFFTISLLGILGYTVTTQTLFMSYDYLDVGLASTLHFIYPAIVCIIEFIIFKKLMGKPKIISLILAGIGVYSLVAFEQRTIHGFGVFLAIFSGVTYSISIIVLSLKEIKDIDNRVTTMYLSLSAAVGMFIYGLFDKSIIPEVNVHLVIAYVLIAVVSTILGIILLLKAIEMIGASSASILSTFEPIISIVLGVILFGEKLTFALFIGGAFIIVSAIIIAKDKDSKNIE